uniref:Malectin-like domain-containing protein n=1 Tax=Oryza meridionalis TaxID=40149 RepID=A0A0E0ER66_9ORYZ
MAMRWFQAFSKLLSSMALILVLFAAFVLSIVLHAAAQPADFLSIDCGLEANYSGYKDANTGIVYVSDEPYVDSGENHRIAADQESRWGDTNLRTLRSFPSGVRNCYTLPTRAGTRYLVRLSFVHGNYDGGGGGGWSTLSFDLYLGVDRWATVDKDYAHEAVFVAWASWAPVCLINTGSGTPFVSVVELRPLDGALYPSVMANQSMARYVRCSIGDNNKFITSTFPKFLPLRPLFPFDSGGSPSANVGGGLGFVPSWYFWPASSMGAGVAAAAVGDGGGVRSVDLWMNRRLELAPCGGGGFVVCGRGVGFFVACGRSVVCFVVRGRGVGCFVVRGRGVACFVVSGREVVAPSRAMAASMLLVVLDDNPSAWWRRFHWYLFESSQCLGSVGHDSQDFSSPSPYVDPKRQQFVCHHSSFSVGLGMWIWAPSSYMFPTSLFHAWFVVRVELTLLRFNDELRGHHLLSPVLPTPKSTAQQQTSVLCSICGVNRMGITGLSSGLHAEEGPRYPGDQYDRFWWQLGYSSPTWKNLSTVSAITQDSIYTVPLTIIQTAVEAVGNNTMLNITWQDQTPRGRGLKFFMYFADFQNSQLRQFNVSFNDVEPYQYSPPYLTTGVLYNSGWSTATDGNYNISLVPTAASKLPPMINALEIYTLISHDNPTTFPVDFETIMAIKLEYGIKKNWMGDPCFPEKFAWEGVKCSNSSSNTARIISLDLSNSNLHGAISNNFTLLTALEYLYVSKQFILFLKRHI